MSVQEVENAPELLSLPAYHDVPDSYRGQISAPRDMIRQHERLRSPNDFNFSFSNNGARNNEHTQQRHGSRPASIGNQTDFHGFRSTDYDRGLQTDGFQPGWRNQSEFSNLIPANTHSGHSHLIPQAHTHQSVQASLPRPRYTEYCMKAVRISSYKSWSSNLKSADMMSEAGFFQSTSSSSGDCVRCFQCGIGLRNWDPEDDPWVEHARWSSTCPYLKEKKGQAFIDLVQAAVRQAQIEETLEKNARDNVPKADLEQDAPLVDGNKTETVASAHTPSAAERKNPLLTSAAQSVLEMGYLPKVVKKAVDEVLRTKGWVGMNATNVLDVVFKYEEEQKSNGGTSLADTIMKVPSNETVKEKIKSSSKSKDPEILRVENEEMKEQKTCKICCENNVSIVFLPCGHLVCCAQCSPALKDCPVCRSSIKGTVRICLA